jgi:hypothetical protein
MVVSATRIVSRSTRYPLVRVSAVSILERRVESCRGLLPPPSRRCLHRPVRLPDKAVGCSLPVGSGNVCSNTAGQYGYGTDSLDHSN